MSVEEILDMDVYDTTGEEIGEVENVLFGADGKVLSVIAEVGGLWDIGDTHVNVPWEEVDVDPVAERVVLPLTEEILEDYTLFKNEVVTASAAATAVQEVSGDGAGLVETAPRVWQARELMDDYARLRDGDTFVNYGYVDDLIIQNGQVSAVIVRPDVGFGARGSYAYPFYGYNYGWRPGATTYDLPYTRADVAGLQPYDDDIWDD
ncbi:PRC-barrel domain-containing protein [Tianweitania sediminis]|uniref:PRC-barrel domain-containing protein n=1 Tax=Tianweitania sediminis TaxID=1502156 RepID=A0A8J7RM96_9HYPH|nr:PRC-barrel domain-containing protein [Tianweitania sediminis]MBP0438339.1 PRC-barrel domain-containing protein [Tianweitania sediminis]